MNDVNDVKTWLKTSAQVRSSKPILKKYEKSNKTLHKRNKWYYYIIQPCKPTIDHR